MKPHRPLALIAILWVAATAAAAGEIDADIDPRFRAKLMKEKSKMNVEQTNPALKPKDFSSSTSSLDGECGSQNIGNVNTGGRPGAAPREIFVFAPNAINIVGARACEDR